MIKQAILLLSVLALVQGVEGKEEKVETEIGFYLTAEDRYSYEVRVSEGGYLLDGSQRITNGIVVYELSVGEKKRFNLEAKEGYELEEIIINGKVQRKEEYIEIQGVSTMSVLEVRYKKKEEVLAPLPDIPPLKEEEKVKEERKEQIPSTGDILEISSYLWIVMLVLYEGMKKRGIDTRECEDIEREEGGKEK